MPVPSLHPLPRWGAHWLDNSPSHSSTRTSGKKERDFSNYSITKYWTPHPMHACIDGIGTWYMVYAYLHDLVECCVPCAERWVSNAKTQSVPICCVFATLKFYTSAGFAFYASSHNSVLQKWWEIPQVLVTWKRTDFRENAINREGQTDCLWSP